MSEAQLDEFRRETRAWLEENCPKGARGPGPVFIAGSRDRTKDEDAKLWKERMAERGWTVPTWPKEYGGGGLTRSEAAVLNQEMQRIKARMPMMGGMGVSMIGPTLLEYGTEEQKKRHLPPIVRGELAWCQGYSEPSAGSDLANVRTRAEDKGDHYLINGQKIWTSGAQFADWMFALVRTDPDAPKHEGISFMLLPMDQPGITVRPIRLISGNSPFCETFFDNATASKDDLVGELNKGWTVGKRLLQHERSGQGGLGGGRRADPAAAAPVEALAKKYIGEQDGKIADPAWRDRILEINMNQRAFGLTTRRAMEENRDGRTPGEATSIFKLYGSTISQNRAAMTTEIMGFQGVGWEGDAFSEQELAATRSWLSSRAVTIFGGTNEVQKNIIAKRVLGLPD